MHLMKKHDYTPQPAPDRKKQQRVIITTDLEVDDMNGILLTLMYATDFDLAGIVWTAGMWHFNGDGEHTLGEICPHYRCQATHMNHTIESAAELKEFRPVDPHWLDRVIDVYYRHDYKYLSKNHSGYPTPDELLSIAKVGNIAFEGDYRFDTEGSELIKSCLLDDDMRPLYIQHWGGINTTVRALVSIYETYHGTDQWEAVRDKVVAKIRFQGSGEDYCRKDSGIDEMFPGMQDATWTGFGSYGQYFAAAEAEIPGLPPFFYTPPELKHFYHGEYLMDAFKYNHGAVMAHFHLMDDGIPIYGEPYVAQFGLHTVIDWPESARQGYDTLALVERFPRVEFKRMDWMCCQFHTDAFIDLGFRQGIVNRDPMYTRILFEELAARADWAIMDPEYCNHAPVVNPDCLDFTVSAGETVLLSASVSDPDGDALTVYWWMPENAQTYAGCSAWLESESVPETEFTVPADAKPGDRFVINMAVRDDAERPMTRFAQFTVTVC